MSMDPFGLAGHAANSQPELSSSGDSEDDSDDDQSVDSAELRAAEAAARLRDFGESHAELRPKTMLPSALDAFDEVSGKPAFLDPEATRPLAVSATHGLAATGAAAAAGGQQRGKKGPGIPDNYDISKLAPALKGQQQQQSDKRGPPGSVIEGKAKRYKLEDGPEASQQYTPAQIAMMGGNVEHLLSAAEQAKGSEQQKPARGPATKPMGVTDFLDKGLGGAVLPRKHQDRKDKEKLKRAAGQSTHAHWKSEAEMVLRQQYD